MKSLEVVQHLLRVAPHLLAVQLNRELVRFPQEGQVRVRQRHVLHFVVVVPDTLVVPGHTRAGVAATTMGRMVRQEGLAGVGMVAAFVRIVQLRSDVEVDEGLGVGGGGATAAILLAAEDIDGDVVLTSAVPLVPLAPSWLWGGHVVDLFHPSVMGTHVRKFYFPTEVRRRMWGRRAFESLKSEFLFFWY